MAVISKINNVDTSGTSGINNIFGSGSGGGGLTAPAIGSTNGVQTFGGNITSLNTGLDATFNRGPHGLTNYAHTDFVRISAKKNKETFFAITNDGKLHYNTTTNSWMVGMTIDGEWHEDTSNPTGTSGNWTDIVSDDQSSLAVRGGDICFRGYGNYRQRGDGSTSSTSTWVKVYDGSSDAAVRVYMGYRVAYMVTASGRIYSTGYRYEGMTGEGTTSGQQSSWTNITPAGITVDPHAVGVGYRSCKFIDTNGDVWSFGDNNNENSGPLATGTSDNLVPTQSTNTQPFLGGKLLGGADGDMFFILDSSGQLWAQGEGSARTNPLGGSTDRRNNWVSIGTAGTWTEGSDAMTSVSGSDQITYFVRSDGSMDISGLDGAEMTASPSSTGVAQSGAAPFNVLGSGNNVHMVSGGVNNFMVVYKS